MLQLRSPLASIALLGGGALFCFLSQWGDGEQSLAAEVSSTKQVAANRAREQDKQKLPAQDESLLIAKADALLKGNDIFAARLVLTNLAKMGSARAAYMLAQTFDPAFANSAYPPSIFDLKQAQKWYETSKLLSNKEADPTLKPKALRLLVVDRPPMTNSHREGGGIALELLTTALKADGTTVSVQWIDGEKAFLETMRETTGNDIGLFWQTFDCQSAIDPSANETTPCNAIELSDPIMQAVQGLFIRADSLSPLEGNAQTTACISEFQKVGVKQAPSVMLPELKTIKMTQRQNLLQCFAALQDNDVDAVVATEPEADFVIRQLKLSNVFQLSKHISIQGLHALVSKANPARTQLLATVNKAIKDVKSSPRYFEIMQSHLGELMVATAAFQ